MDPEPKTPAPEPAKGADQPQKTVDINSILLPKKDVGPSVDSAQRVTAGALLAQEEKAGEEGTPAEPVAPATAPKIGEVSVPAVPPPPKKEESVVRAVQTYGTDINRVVQSGTVSVTSIAAAEAERRARATVGEPVAPQALSKDESSPVRLVLIIAGSILLLSTAGIAAALLLRPSTQIQTTAEPDAPFLAVDQTIVVPLPANNSRDVLVTSLEAARQQVNLSLGLVARVYVAIPTTTSTMPASASAQDFLAMLAPDMPQSLLRAIEPTYLLGVHSFDENQAFLILRVDSYQQAYSGMLAWEESMQRDLTPLFMRRPAVRLQEQSAGTTTATGAAPEQVLQTGFVDRIVQNHDARVVQTASGDLLLLWTFLDRNTVVIATNEYTLGEVIRRLNTSSLVPQP